MIPVRNEERDLAPSVRRLDAYLCETFPFTTRITIADNGSTDGTWQEARALAGELVLGPGGAAGAARARRGAAVDLAGQRRRHLRLHGRGPVDRPERPAPAAGAAAVGPLRRGHRHPAGPRRAGHPRPAPRDHLPLLQPAPARHARHRVLRRPVRLQGHPRRRGPAAAAADHRHRLVLRHRAAGAGRAGRAAHPRGPGGLDRRRRLPGQHHRHRPGRPARHHPPGHRAGPRHHQRPGAGQPLTAGAARGAGRSGPRGWPADRRGRGPAGAVRHGRGGQHRGLRSALPAVPRGHDRADRERRQPAGHRDRQHRGQPAGSPSASAAAPTPPATRRAA